MMHEHKHEWVVTDDSPHIEDGAAITTEECTHVEILDSTVSEKHDEVFQKEGERCETTRTTRFEEAKLTRKQQDKPNISYLLDSTAPPSERGTPHLREHLATIPNTGEITSYDSCKQTGEVITQTSNWKLTFKPV